MATPIQNVLQAIQYARTRRLQQQEVDQQAERDRQNAENQRALLDLHKKDQDMKERQLTVTLAAAKALHKAQLIHDQMEMTKALQGGQTVPGARLISSDQSGNSTYQLPIDTSDLEEPNPAAQYLPESAQQSQGTQVTVNPQKFAEQQAELTRTLLAPKTEAQVKVQGAKDEAAMDRVKAAQDAQDLRAKLERASRELIARNSNATRLATAGLTHQSELGEDPGIVANLMNQLASGQVTQESIKKQFPKSASQIFAGLTNNGLVALTDKQTPLLQDLGSIKQLVDLSEQLINLQKAKIGDTDSRIHAITVAPGLLLDSNVSNLRGQINAGLAGLARTAGGLNRLNMQEINQAKGLTPDLSLPPTENAKRLNNLKVLVGKLIDQKLSNIPKKQRALIKQTYGLDQFGGEVVPQESTRKFNLPPGVDVTKGTLKIGNKFYRYKGQGDKDDLNNYNEVTR